MRHVAEDVSPPLTERDAVLRTDADWKNAAQACIAAKQQAYDAAAGQLCLAYIIEEQVASASNVHAIFTWSGSE